MELQPTQPPVTMLPTSGSTGFQKMSINRNRIIFAIEKTTPGTLTRVWQELEYVVRPVTRVTSNIYRVVLYIYIYVKEKKNRPNFCLQYCWLSWGDNRKIDDFSKFLSLYLANPLYCTLFRSTLTVIVNHVELGRCQFIMKRYARENRKYPESHYTVRSFRTTLIQSIRGLGKQTTSATIELHVERTRTQ